MTYKYRNIFPLHCACSLGPSWLGILFVYDIYYSSYNNTSTYKYLSKKKAMKAILFQGS